MNCEGCNDPLTAFEAARWRVCMECTRARHKAATRGGCPCTLAKARPRTAKALGRTWTACDRCLGTIPGPKAAKLAQRAKDRRHAQERLL